MNELEKEIVRIYFEERLSQQKVAKIVGVGASTIQRILARLNIQCRDNCGTNHPKYKGGLRSRPYEKFLKDCCEECGGL